MTRCFKKQLRRRQSADDDYGSVSRVYFSQTYNALIPSRWRCYNVCTYNAGVYTCTRVCVCVCVYVCVFADYELLQPYLRRGSLSLALYVASTSARGREIRNIAQGSRNSDALAIPSEGLCKMHSSALPCGFRGCSIIMLCSCGCAVV